MMEDSDQAMSIRPATPLQRRPGNLQGISIRTVRADDGHRIVEAFRALDPASVYQRFLFPRRELSALEIRQLTGSDGIRSVVLVATVGGVDQERIVALAQYVRRGESAEIAFAVEEDFQGRGIASALLRQLTDIARRSGVVQFEADVLADNAPMLTVFQRSGLPTTETKADGIVHLTLRLVDRTGTG